MQETDLEPNYPIGLLNFTGYNIESELNIFKSRTAIYIKQGILYTKRPDLEDSNSGLIYWSLQSRKKYFD